MPLAARLLPLACSGAAALSLLGCSGKGPPAPGWAGATCAARPRAASPAPFAASPLDVPRSRVLVDVRIATGETLRELEKAVPRRIAERKGIDIGDAGRLSFSVDRGPFGVKVSGDDLVVEVDLQGEAEMCKPLGLLGCVSYASCSPRAHASAALRLLVTDDYRLLPSRVAIPMTQPCTMTALQLDVSGEVQKQANQQAENLKRRIDGALPDVGPTIETLWKALGSSISLGASSCVRVTPRGVLQTGPRQRDDALLVGVGVEGEVLVEAPCGAPRPPPPLPPPRVERGLEPGIELRIPLLTRWPEVSLAVARSLALSEPLLGDEVVHITDARAFPAAGGRVRLALQLAGRVCGEVWLEATPVGSDAAIALDQVSLLPGEQPRLQAVSPRIDLSPLGPLVSARVRIPLPADVLNMPRRIDQLAARLLNSDPGDGPVQYEVKVAMASARVEQAQATSDGLAAVVGAAGEAKVLLRPR